MATEPENGTCSEPPRRPVRGVHRTRSSRKSSCNCKTEKQQQDTYVLSRCVESSIVVIDASNSGCVRLSVVVVVCWWRQKTAKNESSTAGLLMMGSATRSRLEQTRTANNGRRTRYSPRRCAVPNWLSASRQAVGGPRGVPPSRAQACVNAPLIGVGKPHTRYPV